MEVAVRLVAEVGEVVEGEEVARLEEEDRLEAVVPDHLVAADPLGQVVVDPSDLWDLVVLLVHPWVRWDQ